MSLAELLDGPEPPAGVFRASVGYCAICERRVLYVDVAASPRMDGLTASGEVVDLEPSPSGRWVDRGDGAWVQRRVDDGSGRRPHRCGSP